ncbi:ISAs1 family transposase [Protofrankia symbiont of Coriaria ruscifolia]|uniref:ISAs1 family transposase n=1 Tax=Protofrankia symbiont of Coriaria ruscifolia TaxID=1306542 RepID=UPI001F5EA161|nr:ISAs1 family transposase [Protofrankia symbiont of Coriaria ruscifolia]
MPVGASSRAVAGVVAAGGMLREEIWDRLARVPDPRSPRGRVYPLPCLLAVWLRALTAAGHDAACAVGQWVARASPAELPRLRLPFDPFTGRHRVPDEATLRRLLARVDRDALVATLLGDTASVSEGGLPTAVAVDGKTSRGARRADGTQAHLLGVATHGTGLLAGQVEVEAKSNETTAFPPLLAALDLTGVTVTFDAMHTVRANLDWLVTAKNAHYVAIVKANQPLLHTRLARLPWVDVLTVEVTRDHGHGRDETRTLKVATVGFLDFPTPPRLCGSSAGGVGEDRRPSRETVYLITDHPAETASPADLAAHARRHWHVENKVHYVRDVSFGEDASTLRTGNIPTNIATLRSTVINRLRRAGYRFIPPSRRDHTTPTAALDLHGFP